MERWRSTTQKTKRRADVQHSTVPSSKTRKLLTIQTSQVSSCGAEVIRRNGTERELIHCPQDIHRPAHEFGRPEQVLRCFFATWSFRRARKFSYFLPGATKTLYHFYFPPHSIRQGGHFHADEKPTNENCSLALLTRRIMMDEKSKLIIVSNILARYRTLDTISDEGLC